MQPIAYLLSSLQLVAVRLLLSLQHHLDGILHALLTIDVVPQHTLNLFVVLRLGIAVDVVVAYLPAIVVLGLPHNDIYNS